MDESSGLFHMFGSAWPANCVVVEDDKVSIEDMLNMRPGHFVRDRGIGIRVVEPEFEENLGCIAGWISDEA